MYSKNKTTKLTLTIDDTTVSYESPYTDLNTMDLLEAFNGLLVAHTFSSDSVLEACKEFIENNTKN